MAKTYWSSAQVTEYLGISANNLRQITHRQKLKHEEMGCRAGCIHMVVSHGGGRHMTWYDSDSVKNYALIRKGQINPDSARQRKERKERHEYDNPRQKAKRGRK